MNRKTIRLAAAMLALAFIFFTGCHGVPSGIIDEHPTPQLSREPAASLPLESPFPLEPVTCTPSGEPQPFPDDSAAPSREIVKTTLYYLTDDGYILPVAAEIPWEEGIAKACLGRLVATRENANSLKRLGLVAPIPDGTEIQLSISDGNATVNLKNMPELSDYESEQRLFTAIVNTLTEFKSVETVSIFINGQNLKTANGSTLPERRQKMALNVENEAVATSGSASPVTLYFPNSMGSSFIPVTRFIEGGAGLYAAVSGLVSGTELNGLLNCFPENTLVLGAAIENGILTVNLSRDFERIADNPALFSLAMHTTLLTARQFGGVDEIRFTINGIPFDPTSRA